MMGKCIEIGWRFADVEALASRQVMQYYLVLPIVISSILVILKTGLLMPFLPSLPDVTHLSDLYKAFPYNFVLLMEYTDGILRAEGELSVAQRELIATFTSGVNSCEFCFQSHLIYAKAFGVEEGVLDGLLQDIDSAPVDDKLKPILNYVKKLNHLPRKIVQTDVEAVYAAGSGEQALYEAVQVCALLI